MKPTLLTVHGRSSPLCCVALLACSAALASAADIFKADNADALNLGSSWSGGTAPGAADVAVWNNLVSAANATSSLGADLSWAGIRIANPGAAVLINAGNTLTNGAAGIDLSAATQDLTLDNNLEVGASQTWNIGSGRVLTISTPISGAGTSVLTKGGAGTLALTSTVNGTFSGATVVNGGVLQLNSANGNNNSALGTGIITNNGATLRLGAARIIGNALHFNGNCIVDANGFGAPMDGAWSGTATVQIINLTNSTATFTIGGNGNGGGNMNNFTGTIRLSDDTTGTLRFNNGGGNNNVGNASATFDFGNSSAVFFSRNRNATVNFGELIGGPNTTIRQGASSSGTTAYSIGAKNTSTTFAGQIIDGGTAAAGLVAITKVGTGTLTLTGTNTYLGGTTVNAGTLQIGNGGTSGLPGLGAITLNNGTSLILNRSDDFEITNTIGGSSGTVVKQGPNTLTYYGTNNSGSVGFLVSQATFAMGEGAVVAGPISLAVGGILNVSAAPNFVLGGTVSGVGTVVGPLTAGNNATISPAGAGAAGALHFVNGLTETGGVLHSLDLSDDPTGISKANDLINVSGNLTLSGTNNLLITPLNGTLGNGTYTLIKYTGNLVGSLDNLTKNVGGTLTNPPGVIALIVAPGRLPANLIWKGDGVANTWDTATSNWFNGSVLDHFQAADTARFTDQGSTNPPVNVAALLTPQLVAVDATRDYTFAGSGSIIGSGGLTKTHSGALTILNVNGYTGPTTIFAGTLSVTNLANGGAASAIGASSSHPTNWVIGGATMRYDGLTASTDRGATLNLPGATMNISLDTENLTIGGTVAGDGGLTKIGAGTLTLAGVNTFAGGTIISNGVLALGSQAANSSGLGPTNSPVTFHGGTLELFGYNGPNNVNYSALRNPLIVPASQTGTLRMFSRGPTDNTGITSPLSGSGTLNLVVNYLRGSLDGDWSAFSGSLVVTGKAGADHFRINNTFGYASASIYLHDGVTMYRNGGANTTTDIGELAGGPASFVSLNNVSQNNAAANPTWRVGAKNTSASYDGVIQNDGTTSIIKVGTGSWTLNGVNTYSGSTTVSNGVLALGPSGSIDNSATIRIASPGVLDVSAHFDQTLNLGQAAGQMLQGDGSIRGSLNVGPLGTNAPGFSVGRLTVTNAITLGSGSYTIMELDRSASLNCDKLAGATIALGGNLVVQNNGANLQAGDTFDLFDGTLSGSFESVTLPSLYTFNTNNLTVNGTIVVTSVPTAPIIGSIALEGGTNVVLRGGAGAAPANATYYVVASTNLGTPVATWAPVLTNQVQPDGSYSATIPIGPGTPQDYFRLLFP